MQLDILNLILKLYYLATKNQGGRNEVIAIQQEGYTTWGKKQWLRYVGRTADKKYVKTKSVDTNSKI